MKTSKILCAGLLALATAGFVSAETVKLTGSTAFRKATVIAIVNALNNPVGASVDITTSTADMTGSKRAIIQGTLKTGPQAGQTVAYQLAWGGSVGGVQMVVQNATVVPLSGWAANQTWLATTNTMTPLTATATTVTGATPLVAGSAAWEAATIADACNSDSAQSSTPYKTPALVEEAGGSVGVIDFFWVLSNNSTGNFVPSSPITNITNLQAQSLLAAGNIPASLFTGNAADNTKDILLVGRNNDSGTRLAAEAESGYGFNQIENQYQPVVAGGVVTGVTNVGNVGYSGGGNVATALATPQQVNVKDDLTQPFLFIGYVGEADTTTAVTGGATALNWNGNNSYNNAGKVAIQAPILNGQYTFWTYEHTYYRSNFAVSFPIRKAALDNVAVLIRTTTADASGIPITSMNVSRAVEGGPVN